MLRMIFFITMLLFVIVLSESTRYHDYIHLVKDVHNYYETTCIVFTYSNYTDFNMMTLLHEWTKEFSYLDILTATMTFAEIQPYIEENRNRISRPLFVPFLDTKESFHEFSQITNKIYVSFPIWFVMFFEFVDSHENPSLKDFCLNPTWNIFHVAFDTEMLVLCYDDPVLREWYAISDNRTRTNDLATWRPGEAMRCNSKRSQYARRDDMFGEVLRISMAKESPIIDVKNGILTNFLGDVIIELSRVLNFTIKPLHPVKTYGAWNKDEQVWSGVIGQLNLKVADFGVSDFAMTPMRMDVVDFTYPLLFSHYRLFFAPPVGSMVHWTAYIKVFDRKIWTALYMLVLSVPFLLAVMKTKGCGVMRALPEYFTNVFGIFCQQGLSVFPNEIPLRLGFLSLFLTALIVSSAYSASLISFLTCSKPTMPFSNVNEFSEDKSYELIVYKNSAEYEMIMKGVDNVSLGMQRKMKKAEELPRVVQEGLQKVCGSNVGFYTNEVSIEAVSFPLPCRIAYIKSDRMDNLALTLTKQNPFTGIINFNLQRFKENGIMSRIKSKNLRKFVPSNPQFIAVGFWNIVPIISCLAGAIASGILLLMIEKMYYHYQSRENKTKVSNLLKTPKKSLGRIYTIVDDTKRKKSNDLKTSLREY